jgi:hypothetical protein
MSGLGNDIDAQLPIRSVADGDDERVHVKIVDYTDPDGVDKQVEVSEKMVHNKNHGEDSDGIKKEQMLSQEGHNLTNGDYDATLNKRPSSQGTILHDRKDTAETPAEADQNVRPTGVTYDNGVDETVVCSDVAIRDEDGVPYSQTNPMPVTFEESEGDEIHEQFESVAAIAKDASDDQIYTVTGGKTFLLEQWGISSSGHMKAELFVETAPASAVFTLKDVLYGTAACPNDDNVLRRGIKVAAGVKVKITRYNMDNQSMGLNSFINGLERA